ncbi:MAG: permease [Meiothermus sp.]|uniref:permease n=1 Tax=Meiothermus sp. TaxID=1955249 RepID=UPI0028CC1ADD|nr:permease [Meiothermus sp.]MDT7919975.1 permease [Meiothermus sp.]
MNTIRLSKPSPWIGLGLAALAWVVLYRSILPFWDWVVYQVLGLAAETRLGEAVHFFLYDTSKILLLLCAIIFVVAVIRSFFSVERTRALLGGRRLGVGNLLAAVLGVVTPFCSCSAVPAFIGFVSAGVPLGITLTFLIASPMVNEVALVLLYGLFGWQIAALYLVSGLTLAVVAGLVLGRMGLERYVEPFVYQTKVGKTSLDPALGLSWEQRFEVGLAEVRNILGKIWPYLLLGIGLGAVIHGWVPADLFVRYAGANNPLAVPVAVLLGIPLYSNAAGILPLIEVLYQKGIPMGTLLSFMMAVVALSLPEMILLRRVLKPRLIVIWVSVVGMGIILTGYLFNAVL